MHEINTDVNGALEWIERRHSEEVEEFLKLRKQIPEGEVVEQYVWGIGNLLRGADCWFFESERYFGVRGPAVQRTRRVDAGLELNQLEPLKSSSAPGSVPSSFEGAKTRIALSSSNM